jgi:hypothetical protein
MPRACRTAISFAGRRACQQQVGHVAASDQQHQGDRAQHHPKRYLDVADLLVEEWDQQHFEVGIFIGVIGILLDDAARHGGHIRPRLLQAQAGFDARNHAQAVAAAIIRREIGRGKHQRRPHFCLARHFKARRQHADDLAALAVHDQLPPQNRAIGPETPPP